MDYHSWMLFLNNLVQQQVVSWKKPPTNQQNTVRGSYVARAAEVQK